MIPGWFDPKAKYTFPQPIAVVYADAPVPRASERLHNTLIAAEVTCRFLSWVSLADALAQGIPSKRFRLNELRSPGFGTYPYFLRDVRRELGSAGKRMFFSELEPLIEGAWLQAVLRLVEVRNRSAHHADSYADDAAAAEMETECADALSLFFDGLGFLWRSSHYVMGAVRDATIHPNGHFEGHLYPSRGVAATSPVRLEAEQGVPTDVAMVIDLSTREALITAPFFVHVAGRILSLDRAEPPAEQPAYRPSRPSEPPPRGAPRALCDPRNMGGPGVALQAFLAQPQEFCRRFALGIDAGSWARLRASATPTMLGEPGTSPKPVEFLAAQPIEAASRPPEPDVQPLQVSLPPLAPQSAHTPMMFARTQPVWNVPPLASAPVAPRASRKVGWAVGAAVAVALALVASTVVASRLWRSERPSPQTTSSRLDAAPQLLAFVREWQSAVHSGGSLDRFYLPLSRYSNIGRGVDPMFIAGSWGDRLTMGGRFEVTEERSDWYTSESTNPDAAPQCRSVSGARSLYVLRLWAAENGHPRGLRSTCRYLEGPYIVRLVETTEGLRICHETWLATVITRWCP